MNWPSMREMGVRSHNAYGDGKSSVTIVKILKTIPLKGIIQKKFYEKPNVIVSAGAGSGQQKEYAH
jgi:hypothetical protein